VREPESLARAREWFEVPSQLVPDLALVAPMPLVEAEPVVEIVWIARTDKESRGFQPPTDAADVELCDWMPVPDSELASRPDLPPGMRERLERNTLIMRAAKRGEELKQWELARLWEQLSRDRLALACAVVRRGRVVVTDRLHVHLMALHMGIPTVLADNSYGKVRAVYDSYTVSAPTARWARSPAEALAMARNWLGELDSAG
jgi:pyruvyl transferase EpsO